MEHSLVEPSSPYTKFSMVVDVEALVFSSGAEPVLEQVGFCVVNDRGNIVTSGRFFIYQPFTIPQLAERNCLPVEEVERSVYFYQKITRDSYLHFNTNGGYADETTVKEFVSAIAESLGATAYAKNTKLEERVFGNLLHLLDLEWYGCPKYPFKVHDPQKECIFFAQFIPNLHNNTNNINLGQSQFQQQQQQQHHPPQQYQSWGNRCGQLLKDACTTFINTSPMVFQQQQQLQQHHPQSSPFQFQMHPPSPSPPPPPPEPIGVCTVLNTSSSNASYTPSAQIQTLSMQQPTAAAVPVVVIVTEGEDAKRTYAQAVLGVRTPTPSSPSSSPSGYDDSSSTYSSRSSSPCYDATAASFVPDRFLDVNAVTLGSRPHPVFYKGKTTKQQQQPPPQQQMRYVQKTFPSMSAGACKSDQQQQQPRAVPSYMQRSNTFIPTLHGAAAIALSTATTVSASSHASSSTTVTASPSFVKKQQQQIPPTSALAETTFSRQSQREGGATTKSKNGATTMTTTQEHAGVSSRPRC